MKVTLEKFYLLYRLPALLFLSVATAILVGVNQWLEYKDRTAKYPTWTVKEVLAGDSFTVTSNLNSQPKTIKLCGVSPVHPESFELPQI